jgi:hypothetical protein
MEIINEVDNKLDENLNDLREFNNQNKMISYSGLLKREILKL